MFRNLSNLHDCYYPLYIFFVLILSFSFVIGTSHSGGYSQEAVVYALKHCNYRLIDTAKRYGCEEFLQSAIHVSSCFLSAVK